MPNGGFPIWMVLSPKSSSAYVIFCEAGNLRVFNQDEWRRAGRLGIPLLSLSKSESAVLATFLGHWTGVDLSRPKFNALGVQVEYT